MSFLRVEFGHLEADQGVAVFVGCVVCEGSEVLGLGGKVFRFCL